MKTISVSVLRKVIRVSVNTCANLSDFSQLVEAAIRVENTLAEEGRSSIGKRSSADLSEGKGSDVGFSKQAKYGFSQRSHWDDDRHPKYFELRVW